MDFHKHKYFFLIFNYNFIMIKKVFLVLLVAVLTASYAHAQFTFGARAGLNLTLLTGDEDASTGIKPGFQVGVVGDYAVSDAFSIQPGILFATMGGRESEGDLTATLNFNYIQVPVNFQFKRNAFFWHVGPYIGFGLGGKATVDVGGLSVSDDIKFGSDEDFKAFDFGFGAGIGWQFGNFQAGLGTNLGLVNISNVDDFTMRNMGIAITLTYMFGR